MRMKSMILLLLVLALALPLCAAAEGADEITGYSHAGGHRYVLFGAYPTEEDGTVQPILWRVLRAENGEAWLLSEYILFAAPVHGDHEHYAGWESSDLYKYLNEVFINDAFSAGEQSALLCRTEDSALVTLITSNDMKDASIGFSSNKDRLCESTPYASVAVDPPIFELPSYNFWKEQRNQPHLFKYQKGGFKYSPWWSRTVSSNYRTHHIRIMDEGAIGHLSTGNSDMGVRPTVYIDLSQLTVSGGSGAMSDPWVLTVLSADVPDAPTEEPVPEPTPEATEAPVQDAPDVTPEPEAEPEPTEIPAQPKAAVEADPHFPALTAEGYLPEGEEEFTLFDEENGLWLYASQTLRIEINRRSGTNAEKKPVQWYEAHIYSAEADQFFRPYAYEKDLVTKWQENKWKMPDVIARKNGLVFAINADHFIYRVARTHDPDGGGSLGLIIRDGEILFEKQKNANSQVYPPLDIMALYPDGTAKVMVTQSMTGKEVLATGATDTLSFGPILVDGGEISPRSRQFGETFQPRTAFGIAEPGHFVALVVEGRRSGISEGQSCFWLADKMLELGCQTAINLDGGGTSVMLLMGKQINYSGSYTKNHRLVNEVFGIGHSDAVQPLADDK